LVPWHFVLWQGLEQLRRQIGGGDGSSCPGDGVARGKGWEKSKPIAPNTKPDGSDNPEGRARNRRVEITVTLFNGIGDEDGASCTN